ncbi:vanadium-dependent haloperoxidase [Pontibacter toksunensis]|uniref:Vanadium-dependent haloperoxidase n=1 Tax=Pontibacter toksunensis TaxID=1332631 RepID=A0ABW6C0G9_9BACT
MKPLSMPFLSMRNRRKASCLFVLFLFSFLYSCEQIDDIFDEPPKDSQGSATQESATVVYDWYKFIARIQLHTNPQPVTLLNNRNFAYIGVGLYEAVRPGIKGAVSLSTKLYLMPAMPKPDSHRDYLWGAAANAALASMFKQLLVGLSEADIARIDSMENAYNNRFRLSTSDAVISRSQTYGRAVATAIYNWSTTDNFNLSSQGYELPQGPGAWVPNPPGFANPVGPFLKNSRPFLAYSLTATTPPLPFPYSEDESSQFYEAAKEVYDISKTLTDEQKAIARWWADGGGTGVGIPLPGHLLSIVTGILESRNAKLGRAAEIYAKTGIAMRDGHYIVFRDKYLYNLLQPVIYIRRHIDPTWLSYLPSPPYPEYPSGKSGYYSPVMQVLIQEFGDIPVTDNAYAWRGDEPRHYGSISELNQEVAMSRVYGGIHYKFTMDTTREIGRELGNYIANIELTPQ